MLYLCIVIIDYIERTNRNTLQDVVVVHRACVSLEEPNLRGSLSGATQFPLAVLLLLTIDAGDLNFILWRFAATRRGGNAGSGGSGFALFARPITLPCSLALLQFPLLFLPAKEMRHPIACPKDNCL